MAVELGVANRKITRLVGKANSLKEKTSRLEDKRQELLNNALEILRKEQIGNYIHLGFHSWLGLSETEYVKSMPNNILVRPDRTLERFKFPVVVETRIPIEELFESVGVNISPAYYVDYISTQVHPRQDKPYVAWMRDGQPHKEISVEKAMKGLGGDERVADIFEGVALITNYPEILRDRSLVFPGTPIGRFTYQEFAGLELREGEMEFFILHKHFTAAKITVEQRMV